MSATVTPDASMCMLETESTSTDLHPEGVIDEELQEKCVRNASTCCYVVTMVLTVAVIALFVALTVRKDKLVTECPGPCYVTCPTDWIGFGSQCFHFSEHTNNWASSLNFCMALAAHLTLFDSPEEMIFLRRYNDDSDRWIGLQESHQNTLGCGQTTLNTTTWFLSEEEETTYLSDNRISSGRNYTHRKWICSKPKAILCKGHGF